MRKVILFALAAVSAFGAGSVIVGPVTQVGTSNVYTLTWAWTGDASDGSVPATTTLNTAGYITLQGQQVIGAEFIPSSPAPTSNYDVTVTTQGGFDVLGGGGANLSASTASTSLTSPSALPLNGPLTMTLTNNSVASARGQVVLYFMKSTTSSTSAYASPWPGYIKGTGGIVSGPLTVMSNLKVKGGSTVPGSEIGTFTVYGSTDADRLGFGYNSTSAYGWIQSARNGITYTPLVLQGAGGVIVLGTGAAPATSSTSGIAGQIGWDSDYLYIAVGPSQWKRVAISTW